MLKYLTNHPDTKFIAPKQAVDKLLALNNSDSIIKQTISIDLNREDKPKRIELGDLLIEAVRIPHAGWPSRADISNLVFRVTLSENVTVMHMGDADPNDIHFKQYESYWQENLTNTAFPPYWFFASKQGPFILNERINTEQSVGIHVPVNVPDSLIKTGKAYFSKPKEHKDVGHKH